MRPLDIVKTDNGSIGMITEITERGEASIVFIERATRDEKIVKLLEDAKELQFEGLTDQCAALIDQAIVLINSLDKTKRLKRRVGRLSYDFI